jgi:hypothetical protein
LKINLQEPLNSEDDVSDEDPTDLFDTDNVVVCQYDKVSLNHICFSLGTDLQESNDIQHKV